MLIHALLRTERYNIHLYQKKFIIVYSKVVFTTMVSSVAEFGIKDGRG